LGRTAVFDTVFQRALQVQTGRTAEDHQIQQRVTTQTVGAVYRYASHLAYCEQTVDDAVVTVQVLGNGLTMDIGSHATHHVVTGRDHRHRSGDRVNEGEGPGQFTDTRQNAVQHFHPQVVQLQHHVVAIRTTAVTGQDLFNHGAGYHVATGKVLGVGRIAFHEALAVLVDQVSTFTTATFGNQYPGTGNTGRVELPHFHVLYRHAGTQRHADAVAGVDQGIGSGGVDTARTTGGQHGGLGTDIDGFAGFNADGDNANDSAVLVLHQVNRVPLIKEGGVVLDVVLVQGVQQGVTGTVGCGAGAGGLATVTVILGLATERTLVDTALLGTGERQTHVFQFENGLRANGTHVFDSVLVTDIVGALDGIVHVPAPIIIRVRRGDRAGNTALGGYSVRTGREHLGNHSSLVTALSQLQRCAHTGTTTTNNDGVKSQSTHISH